MASNLNIFNQMENYYPCLQISDGVSQLLLTCLIVQLDCHQVACLEHWRMQKNVGDNFEQNRRMWGKVGCHPSTPDPLTILSVLTFVSVLFLDNVYQMYFYDLVI